MKKIFSNPERVLSGAFMFFCVFLPFQFALNPAVGIDLAIIRIIVPLLFIVALGVFFKNRTVFEKSKLTFLLLFLALLSVASLFFSANLIWSLRKLFFLVSIVPIYFVASIVMQEKKYQRASMQALVIGGTILSFLAILQFLSQFIFGINPVYDFLAHNITPFFLGNSFANAVLSYPSWLVSSGGNNFMRAVAVFPDPHMLSYFMGMLLPWAIALGATSKKNNFWFYLAALSLFVADIFTFTRGGYIALIAGSIIILPLVSKTIRLKIILAIALVFALYFVAPHSPVVSRLTSSFDVQEGSNQGRLSNWQQALLIIKIHPLGVGIGSYSLAVDPNADYREPIYAHDLYLDIAAELGILATLTFMAILYVAINSFWKTSKGQPFFVAGVASLVIFSVHSLVETPLYSVHVLPLFLIILALSMVTKKYEVI